MNIKNIILYFCLLQCTPALGVELDWSGFFSLGAGKVDKDNIVWYDYEDDWSFDTDSILGIQLDLITDSKWNATLQITSKGYSPDKYDNYTPQIAWAYLSYQWSPDLKIRAGRMRSPFFLLSDYIEVGYAYTWVRPPIDVYPLFITSFQNYDGLELIYSTKWKNVEITNQWGLGIQKFKQQLSDVESKIFGANIELRATNTKVRYGLFFSNTDYISSDIDLLISLFSALGSSTPIFSDIANHSNPRGVHYLHQSLSLQHEWSNLLIQAEVLNSENDSEVATDVKGAYVSFAYHFDWWTPYIVFGTYSSKASSLLPGLIQESYSFLPEGTLDFADALREKAVDNFPDNHFRNSTAVGLRYDVTEQIDIKFEINQIQPIKSSMGNFTGTATPPIGQVTLFTVTLDCWF